MNKLNIALGGHPRVADDFNFMLNAIAEALTGLASLNTYNNTKVVILSGIDLVNSSGTTWDWVDGFVWIDGEIYKVDAGTITLTTGSLEWSIVESADSNGTVLYENSATNDTYLIRRAKLIEVGSVGAYTHSLAYKYCDLIVKMVNDKSLTNESWKEVGVSPNPSYQTGYSNTSGFPLRFRKDKLGRVCIAGYVTNPTFSGSTLIFTLPVGYRPLTRQYVMSRFIYQSDVTPSPISIDPNGEVRVVSGLGSFPISFLINEQTFSLD